MEKQEQMIFYFTNNFTMADNLNENKILNNMEITKDDLLKQLELLNKKLQQSEKVKSNFISNVRNEIINPFTGILGLSKSIQSIDLSEIDKIKTMASLIYAEAFNLDFQMKNIVKAAELEAGQCIPQIANTNLINSINNVIEFYTAEARKKNIEIEWNTADLNVIYKTDPSLFELILSNLISNAIKFSYANSKIVIKCELIGITLNISVLNFGTTLDKNHINEIFDRFKQIDSGTTKSYNGNGIGLSVSKALAEILNGNIEVETGQGWSKFTIQITESDQLINSYFSEYSNGSFLDEEEKF